MTDKPAPVVVKLTTACLQEALSLCEGDLLMRGRTHVFVAVVLQGEAARAPGRMSAIFPRDTLEGALEDAAGFVNWPDWPDTTAPYVLELTVRTPGPLEKTAP